MSIRVRGAALASLSIAACAQLFCTVAPAAEAEPLSEARIPLHSLTIGAGQPGTGKSQFAAWLTARITTGTLPGEMWGQPASVAYATTEDSWSMTVAPRLIAAGARLDRVFRVDVADDDAPHSRLTLPIDVGSLGAALADVGAALLVLDPLLSHIDQVINDWRAREVRRALEPLISAAETHHFTVFGLAHFTKSGPADPLARVAGSGAFGQLIRSLIAFARQDEDDAPFVLSTEKNNLGKTDMPGYVYRIEGVSVQATDGPAHVSRFVLGERTTETVSSVMSDSLTPGGRADRVDTGEWLTDLLISEGGSMEVGDIMAAATKVHITRPTLYRAKKDLKLISDRGEDGHRKRRWVLPVADVTPPTVTDPSETSGADSEDEWPR